MGDIVGIIIDLSDTNTKRTQNTPHPDEETHE
jgi:hypothetical protein